MKQLKKTATDELVLLEARARQLSSDEPRPLLERKPSGGHASVIAFVLLMLGIAWPADNLWVLAPLPLVVFAHVMSWMKDEGRKKDED